VDSFQHAGSQLHRFQQLILLPAAVPFQGTPDRFDPVRPFGMSAQDMGLVSFRIKNAYLTHQVLPNQLMILFTAHLQDVLYLERRFSTGLTRSGPTQSDLIGPGEEDFPMTDFTFHHRTDTITGARGEALFTQSWHPEAPSRGNLLVIAGLGDHSGRFGNLIEEMVPLGYSVFGWDHTGHGRSEGTPGHIRSFAELLDPAAAYLKKITEQEPHVPVYIFGHSMGGLLAVRLCQERQPDPAGVILSNPSFSIPEGISPLTVALGRVLSRVVPRWPLSRLDPEMLSRDPEVTADYREDPLVYTGSYSARMAMILLDEIDRAFQRAERFLPPLLTLIGAQDRISFPQDSRRFHEQAGARDKTLLTYPEDRHELINEPDHTAVLTDMAAWMDERTPAA
jgi:alpha-beta hydrolase superfamily lysophospholipase